MILKIFEKIKLTGKIEKLKNIRGIKKNNFLVIILLVLNIVFWNYYLIYQTNVYKNFFYDFNNGNPVKSENNGYLYVNFFSDADNKLVILQTPTNKTVIIDTGGDVDATKILDYMKSKNLVFIDTIFLTTANENALAGLRKVLNTFSVGEIVDGILHGNEKFSSVVSRHPEVSYTKAGMDKHIYIDPYLEFKFYYGTDQKNKCFGNVFIWIQYRNKNILLTADNGYKEQCGLMKTWESMNPGNVDVLEYPYTDAKDTVFAGFINAIKPRYVIVSRKSLVNNDLLDMNIWNNFSAKQEVRYIKEKLTLKTDGEKVYF